MDATVIEDLKVYLATILSQQVGGLRTDMEQGFTKIDKQFDSLETRLSIQINVVNKKIDNLSESVGEALHNFDQATDEQLKDHEKRITKLETAPA